MIQIPISQIKSADAFSAEVESHAAALKRHQMGPPGHHVPIASPLVELVITRQPQDGPVATRGPDDFVVLEYEFSDDIPRPPEVETALSVLRESVSG